MNKFSADFENWLSYKYPFGDGTETTDDVEEWFWGLSKEKTIDLINEYTEDEVARVQDTPDTKQLSQVYAFVIENISENGKLKKYQEAKMEKIRLALQSLEVHFEACKAALKTPQK